MTVVCRSGGQRLLLAAAAVLVLVLVALVTQTRLVQVGPPSPAARQWSSTPENGGPSTARPAHNDTGSVQVGPPSPAARQWSSTPGNGGLSTARPTHETGSAAAETLVRACAQLGETNGGVTSDVRHVMRWVCEQVGGDLPRELDPIGCNKTVVYNPIGRLGNLMGLYAIIYSFGRMYGTAGYVEAGMWNRLHKYFPDISLRSAPAGIKWEGITYQQAPAKLECRPGDGAKPHFYRITNYPDRNGIDVFHPFYEDIRKEFRFSDSLQRKAQEFLWHARGNRSSVTFIGFHVRRTDYQAYIHKKYNGSLPDDLYFNKALSYYREHSKDALFIVCSDDLNYVAKQLKARQNEDIVIAGNRDTGDPGRDMALLSACNHSVVTVGTYGFWGAYLAGGTVLVPEQQTHLSRGDRHAPLLEIQLAGATNWIAMRRR